MMRPGNVIGADPDLNVRMEMRKDDVKNQVRGRALLRKKPRITSGLFSVLL